MVEFLVFGGATLIVAGFCSFVGLAETTFPVWANRFGRLVIAAAVGGGLATAGMALQGILRNPLAEPYILGISSGAGVGVLVGVLLAGKIGLAAWISSPLLALVGAVVTCVVVYSIAQRRGRLDPYALILSGVIVNVFNGAVILTILLFLDPGEIIGYIGWSMGRLPDGTSWQMLTVCGLSVAACCCVLFMRGWAFNCLGLGDDVAGSSGVSVGRLRIETFALVSLMTAAAVSLAGPIGFVGLIIPHICRFVFGADHRRLAITSCFVGSCVLMIADTIGRTVGHYAGVGDIPVGILTALSGGPFFIYLLRRRLREVEI